MGAESLIDGVSPQETPAEGLHVIAYRVMLDVPRELVAKAAQLLSAERHRRGHQQGHASVELFRPFRAGAALVVPAQRS